MKIIARIKNDFKEKFGIPRQSGIADTLISKIIFEPEYRIPEALRGIEGFSHLWLIWQFSEAQRDDWSPTVRPPRLGGNKRVGVFATRSPFRPNPIGLSSVKLVGTELTDEGTVLVVSGADLVDGTPIYDIKPYLAYTDSHPDAVCGFSDSVRNYKIKVVFPDNLINLLDQEKRDAIITILENDPRPSYQDDPTREYGMHFGNFEIRFSVSDEVLTVTGVDKHNETS